MCAQPFTSSYLHATVNVCYGFLFSFAFLQSHQTQSMRRDRKLHQLPAGSTPPHLQWGRAPGPAPHPGSRWSPPSAGPWVGRPGCPTGRSALRHDHPKPVLLPRCQTRHRRPSAHMCWWANPRGFDPIGHGSSPATTVRQKARPNYVRPPPGT